MMQASRIIPITTNTQTPPNECKKSIMRTNYCQTPKNAGSMIRRIENRTATRANASSLIRKIGNRTAIRAIVLHVQEENAHTTSTSNQLAPYPNKSVIGAKMETRFSRPVFVPSISGVLDVSYCAIL